MLKKITLLLVGIGMGFAQFTWAAGNPEKGKALYAVCVACHGTDGAGNKALNSPRIAGQEIWYLERQLKNFKTGVRGANSKDVYGMQMRPMAGKAAYMICQTCHGAKGEGNKALNAPKLINQQDWYMVRQLKGFKEGLRGTHPKDVYGMQMRPMSMTLADDKAINNVVSYIVTFK